MIPWHVCKAKVYYNNLIIKIEIYLPDKYIENEFTVQ